MDWVRQQVQFEQPAQEYTRLDYLHEVDHANDRTERLEEAIREAVKLAPAAMQEVIQALQALRGIAQISAVTIVSELGQISRFGGARELMGYSGAVASEDSSGQRIQRGAITKTGNAHLRRVVIEAAWAYRHRPSIGATLRKRQKGLREEVKEIAWKATSWEHTSLSGEFYFNLSLGTRIDSYSRKALADGLCLRLIPQKARIA
jgi:transposase